MKKFCERPSDAGFFQSFPGLDPFLYPFWLAATAAPLEGCIGWVTVFDGDRLFNLGRGAAAGMVMASTLTGNDVGDPSQVAPLLDQVDAGIGGVTADGAYDGAPTYDAVAAHAGDIPVIIPPHVTAVPGTAADHRPSQRDRHIAVMAAKGRLGWQEETS